MTFYKKYELSETLYNFMKENYLCDVTIVVLGGVSLSAHSVVLATVSNKLKAAFERTHSGGPPRRHNWGYRLTIKECSLESMQAILQFVYTGSMNQIHSKKDNSRTTVSNKQEERSHQSFNAMRDSNITIKSKNICTTNKDDKEAQEYDALGILLAGQKLGLDPTKLARCLKVMMEDGFLNIEDTTPFLVTDEDIMLDVIDKDPDTEASFNLIETMCITTQLSPLVREYEKPEAALNIDECSRTESFDAIKNNSDGEIVLNVPFVKNSLDSVGNFVQPVQFKSNPDLKSAVLRQIDHTSMTTVFVSNPSSSDCTPGLNVTSNRKLKDNSEPSLRPKSSTKLKKSCSGVASSDPHTNESTDEQMINRYCSPAGRHVVNSIAGDEISNGPFQQNLNLLNQNINSSVNLDPLRISKQDVISKVKKKLERTKKNTFAKTLPESVETLSSSSSSERADKMEIILPDLGNTSNNNLEVKDDPSGNATDGSNSHQCDICGRSFSRSYTAMEHKRLHSGEKPYQCDRCGKRFTTCGDLTKHKRSQHGTVKPHVCSICGKEMSTGREVADHKRLHEGGNRCPFCHKTFTRLHNMKEHIRGTHQGHKSFSCTHCDKKFAYSGSLRFHRKQHRLTNRADLDDETPGCGMLKANEVSDENGHRRSRSCLKLSTEIDLTAHDCTSNAQVENLKFPDGEFENLKKMSTILHNEPRGVFSDSEDINRFGSMTSYSNSAAGFVRSSNRLEKTIKEEAENNVHSRQERMEVDNIQEQVLANLAISGVIGFGSND